MPRIPNKTENLRTMYNAIVDYHNNLVNMRFTVAGLYIAATAFLADIWFSRLPSQDPYIGIAILGILLTFIFWVLEIRTRSLVFNLGKRGLDIEQQIYAGPDLGFFELMRKQPDLPIWPFSKEKHIPQEISEELTHSNALNLLYLVILLFWLYQFCSNIIEALNML